MEKFEFIRLLLCHIPEKNFKIVRYVGIYSRRGYKHRQTEFHEGEIILNKRSWREEIEKIISEAAKIGMNREQTISYIEHLKRYGSAYEPIKGEIKCAF